MSTTPPRRIVAIVGAAVIVSITAGAGAAASASTGSAPVPDRPCFMYRAHWNTAEGPQPTCPVPSWQRG